MSARTPSLADVLTRLIRDQRLSYAHIARIGRISRNTVKQIADGKTVNPGPDTLCKIAVGLAVDPYTGRIHQETMVMALDELGTASGHDDLAGRWVRQTLPVLLTTVVGNLETATAWVELIAQFPDIAPDNVRAIVERLSAQRREQ